LNGIFSINGMIEIYETMLTSLEGLNTLSYVAGDFIINVNPALANMTGLESLDSIGGNLRVNNNTELTTLEGLENIADSTIENLSVINNGSLSFCAIQSLCDYLKSPNGTVEIYNNASGCNSPLEVEEACGEGVDEPAVVGHQSSVSCSPNPFHSSIEFRVSGIEFQSVTLKIYNAQGQEVAVVLDGKWPGGQVVRWDTSGLPADIYYYRLMTKDQRLVTGKIVKY
jgi:hypothetical protein